MIQVFCAKRGSGKTKRLIELANNRQLDAKGDAVYIDKDSKPILQLTRGIRFVDTNEYNVDGWSSFYGMLCGILSSNYDIENIYIDGIARIAKCAIGESGELLEKIDLLTDRLNVNVYINAEILDEVPECIQGYIV